MLVLANACNNVDMSRTAPLTPSTWGALIEFVEVVPKPRLPGLVEGEFLLEGDPKAEVTGRPDLEERLLTNIDTGWL